MGPRGHISRMGSMSPIFLALLLSAVPAPAADSALDLFRQRITPILQAKDPSSCSECHLSGVDLKDYIGKTQEETFASLRDAGLVDVKKPAESKLLAFIARSPTTSTSGTRCSESPFRETPATSGGWWRSSRSTTA